MQTLTENAERVKLGVRDRTLSVLARAVLQCWIQGDGLLLDTGVGWGYNMSASGCEVQCKVNCS